MDFVSHIRFQNEKLVSSDYVLHLWHELEENQREVEVNPQAAIDFNNHLPVLVEDFWKLALEKLSDSTDLEEIEEDLKIYLLVLIYHCITQSHDSIPYECVVYASEIYLLLLVTPQSDGFYKSKLYRSTLSTLQTLLETAKCENLIGGLIHKVCCFLKNGKLNNPDLEVTLATLIQIIFIKSKQVIKAFDDISEEASIAHQALQCLKHLFLQETIPSRKFIIITYLFNGLRKPNAIHLTPHNFNIIQINFRNLLRNLHPNFKEDHYKTFLNAFIHVWKHPEFSFYGDAVLIMNSLKEKHYRTLIDILNKMMMTKSPHKNLFKLSLAIICFPPKYSTKEKVEVTNQILLRNILINCISSKNEVSSAAIESLAEILMSPDMEKDYVNGPVKVIFNSSQQNPVNTPIILQGFKSLINKKWSNRSRNKNCLVIIVSIMSLSEDDYPETYREVLEILSEEATPFDLKPFLPLLLDTYVKLTDKNHKYSAFQILKILFKMALHPMASSNEFVKTLYMSMTSTNIVKGTTIKRKIFIEPVISGEFNFVEFFQKCHTLSLIRKEQVCRLLQNLQSIDESDLKLLCAIVHLTDYKDLSVIADHINNNFMTLCGSSNLKYFLYIYNSILKNKNSVTTSHHDLRNNEIVMQFIKENLFKQTLRWNCVANAFALLRNLREITDLSEDFGRLKEEYNRKLTSALQRKDNFLPLFYYSQLVIFGKVTPNEEHFEAITNQLRLCEDEIYRRSPEFDPKIWIGCLLLYTNICTIKTNLAETCLAFLQNALNSSLTSVKLASLNMTFDLCNMTTHSFEDLISYMFKQLVYGDIVLKKTCLLKIDRLIRDDYLKLELEQFLIFVTLLGDRNLVISDFLKQLLSENFMISNTSVIARYFVPLIVHINGYKKHPVYQISSDNHELMQVILKSTSSKRKIYCLLLSNLPIKLRFNIVSVLATTILEKMMKGVIKHDDGFWEMIKDSIFIYKLMATNMNVEGSNENFYKKVVGQISKFLIDKSEYNEDKLYPEFHKEIIQGTETLLKLLFFNDSSNVQKHINIPVFDAIMHWTNFLLAELVYIVHVEKYKQIQNYYVKVDAFFKKNGINLRSTEDSFENESDLNTVSVTGDSLFNVSERYIPHFDYNC